jgi:histidyl-tRNA synthetase
MAGLSVRADTSDRKLGKQLEAAVKAGARWAVIVGEELADGEIGLKDLQSGDQSPLALGEVARAVGESG